MQVREIAPTERDLWDGFVGSHPDATGYQLWAWTDILREVMKLRVHRLGAFRGEDLVGVLPLARQRLWPMSATFISLPFVNYAGILAVDSEAEGALAREAVALCAREGVSRVELRHDGPRANDWGRRTDKVRFVYDLAGGEEAMWKALPGQRRTQVRKAEKTGLTGHAGGVEMFDEFHDLVSLKWRDLGSPILPKPFFRAVLDHFPDDTRFCAVRDGERTAAVGMIYRYNGRVENPWVGALDEYARQQANVLLYWTMMAEAARWGASWFDFGRSSRDSGNYTYKSRWNAIEEDLPWAVWPPEAVEGKESGSAADLVKTVWKRLPLSVANAVGPLLSPNLPL